jgi:Ca2+-binding EF-hand superfamily protein
MIKTFKILSLLAIPLLTTSALYAYEDTDEPSSQDFRTKILEKFDKDGDLQISKAEAPSKMKQHFDRHDLNGDGYIAEAELDTLPRHKGGSKGERPQKNTHGEKPPKPEHRN